MEMISKLQSNITRVKLFMHHNYFEWAPCIETFSFFAKCASVHCTVYRIFDRHTLKTLIWKTLDYQKKKVDHAKFFPKLTALEKDCLH